MFVHFWVSPVLGLQEVFRLRIVVSELKSCRAGGMVLSATQKVAQLALGRAKKLLVNS